jgi:putative oxidoreductase
MENKMRSIHQGVYNGAHGAGPFFGRLLISLIFILSGFAKIFSFKETSEAISNTGLPGSDILAVVALLFEIVGGLLVLLGWYTNFGIYILMIFLLPTTLVFHPFWIYEGAEKLSQQANFLKNLTIYGGLLLLLSYGPGRWSFDARR